MAPRVAVIGAGVIGLSTAVYAQEKIPDLQVTVISDKFSPNTTGDVSAGLWFPYCIKDTPIQDLVRWSQETYNHMLKLWKSVDAADAGVTLLPQVELSVEPDTAQKQTPYWTAVPIGYHSLGKDEVHKLTGNDMFTGGIHFLSLTLEPSHYLPYLTDKFLLNGGKIERRRVQDLQELCGRYDVVVNCSGLQARHLAQDKALAPVRGQVLRVQAPSLFSALTVSGDDGGYIIPNMDSVILGGTLQQDDWNTNTDPNDSKKIQDYCFNIVPALKHSQVVSERAGLRPSRTKVRLEGDQVRDTHGRTLDVIHNYGHGGSGVTLSWGCAHEAVDILQDILNNKFKSKL